MAATFCCGIEPRNGIKALSVFWIIYATLNYCHYLFDKPEFIDNYKTEILFIIMNSVRFFVNLAANKSLFNGATNNNRRKVLVWLIWEMIGIVFLTLYCIIIVTLIVAKVGGSTVNNMFSIGSYIEQVLIVVVSIFFWSVVYRFYKKDMKEPTNDIAALPRMV